MKWSEEDHRFVLYCGSVAVGAVYKPPRGRRYWRWRAWVTERINPVDGSDRSEEAAKRAVQTRFETFLAAAGLELKGGAGWNSATQVAILRTVTNGGYFEASPGFNQNSCLRLHERGMLRRDPKNSNGWMETAKGTAWIRAHDDKFERKILDRRGMP